MKKIRLLLIEDNRLLHDGIISILNSQDDIKIISPAVDNETNISKIKQLKPDIILLDLGLRSRSSLNMVETVKKDFPGAKIIVMDLAPVQSDINLFINAGASGFILKDAALEDFLSTIRTVAGGSKVVPPNLNESLFSQIVENALKDGKKKLISAARMTKREREVIELIGNGLSNKEIAQKLCISTFTVKSHIHNIMEKFALHTRLEVASFSYSSAELKKILKDFTTSK